MEAQWVEEHYLQHRRIMQGAIRRLCKDAYQVEDILQETWISIWLTSATPYEGKNADRWCRTVASNRAIDWLRTHPERTVPCGAPCDGETGFHYPPADAWLQYADRLRVLDVMPEPYRTTLRLFAEGYSYREIQGILGVCVGTIKSRIACGRRWAARWDHRHRLAEVRHEAW